MIGCHWAITNLMHCVELIVKAELPNTHAAFHTSGLCVGTVLQCMGETVLFELSRFGRDMRLHSKLY